jgi:hypothetical protein
MPTVPDENDAAQRLSRQLTGLESPITEVKSFAQGVNERNLPSAPEIEAQHIVLDEVWRQASTVLTNLEGLLGSSQRRAPLMRAYTSTKTELIKLTNLAKRREAPAGSNEGTSPMDQTMAVNGGSKPTHLPRIELPKFSGSPTEWLSFKGRFEKRISTVTEDAEKYIFLQRGLENFEPALNACKAFEDSGLAFSDAWKKLEERFYKKRIAFEGHFNKILKVKRPQKQNSKALLNIVDAVDTMLTSARQIAGEPEGSMECITNGMLVCLV